MGYFIILGFFSLVGMLVSQRLKSKFNQYARVPISNGKSGAEVAADMMRHYGITGVQIVQGKGFLSDHYNPCLLYTSPSPRDS